MGSLTRRPYLLVGFFHMIIGFLLCGCGLTWLLLTIFYWPSMKAGGDEPVSWKAADPWSNFPIQHQVWCWLVYTAQIWTGFWVSNALSFCFAVYYYCDFNYCCMFLTVIVMVVYQSKNAICCTKSL